MAAQMVMYVLDDAERLDEVLEALSAAGVTGATIVESTGMHRRRARRGHLHLRYAFERESECQLRDNLTLFVIVHDEAMVAACVAAVEGVVGDLDNPHNGILTAWPLGTVRGLRPRTSESGTSEEGTSPGEGAR